MKLRHRFATTFAVASLGILIGSRLVTIVSFSKVQEYELDRGLQTRAREEGNEVALLGRKALELEYADKEETDPLEQLVTYGALYRADGSLVADTASFAHAPRLDALGMPPARKLGTCFDFDFHGKSLRGVLVDVSSQAPADAKYLLLAASRRDMDEDARRLLAVGWWVLLALLPLSVALGWWLGGRMTLGLETLARSAGRVTAGGMALEVPPAAVRDEEVAALADALREMLARLEKLIATERRFASHAAHELRSPLTALRGEIELALRRERTAAEYAATLRDALEDTNRLVDLAEDLLVVARVQSGTTDDSDQETVAVGDLVSDAVAASTGRTDSKANILVDCADVSVRGSHVALVRMLRNLLDNAVVHGASADGVRVKARAEDGIIRIDVEDDGAGVSAGDRERVFEPFHRGEHAREVSGAGLGLGIAREIARRHGGDLELDSARSPTRFVVRLPAAE